LRDLLNIYRAFLTYLSHGGVQQLERQILVSLLVHTQALPVACRPENCKPDAFKSAKPSRCKIRNALLNRNNDLNADTLSKLLKNKKVCGGKISNYFFNYPSDFSKSI